MKSAGQFYDKEQSAASLTDAKGADLERYTCPFTKSLFFLPYRAPECGHVFEREIIFARVKTGNKVCPMSGCNCILEIDKTAIDCKLFNEISQMITRDPSLAARRYFSISLLIDILNETAINATQILFLEHLLKILEENPDVLNTVDSEQGYSPLFVLCNDNGRQGRLHAHFILAENAKLRGNITSAGFNAPCTADYLKNLTPFCMLLRGNGFSILEGDPVLRQKVYPKTLTLLAECKSYEGICPLLLLTAGGARFLRQCPDLIDKISSEDLNIIYPQGKYKGSSPALCLASCSDGVDLLCEYPDLRHKIQPSTFEAISESKSMCEGVSLFFVLTATSEGRELLSVDEEFFVNMMSQTGINTISKIARNKGTSPAYYLIDSEYGRALLHRFPQLYRMITLETLCAMNETDGVDNGIFPLLLLAVNDPNLLLAWPGRLTANALLQTCQAGTYFGESPYSFLKRGRIGLPVLIKILKNNIFLRADLSDKISVEDKQFFLRQGISFSSGYRLSPSDEEAKQDPITTTIQNLKIDRKNTSHLEFWNDKTDTCWHGRGGIEIIYNGTSYRVPTHIHKMMELAANKENYQELEVFAAALSKARPSFRNFFSSNPFSFLTRNEITNKVYSNNSQEIASFKV